MNGPPRFEGILATLVTPFSQDGLEIDEKALTSLVSRLIAANVGGLIPCGSTGEFAALTVQERKHVSEIVAEAAGNDIPVVPHTGALTTRETIELSEHAEKIGAAAVMVVPPFYESPGWAELLEHYAAVARSISIPVVVYNIPSASGVRMSAQQISELAAIPGVGFIKDSSGDAVLLTQLLQEFGDRLQVLNGLDSLTFYAFAAGARCSVWGAANFMPELTVALYRALSVDSNLEAGRSLWARIWPICQVLDSTNYASAVKTACGLLGIPVGPPRAPARLLADEDCKRLAVALENAGLLAGA